MVGETVPAGLTGFLDLLASIGDRQDRIELLIDTAERFREVSPDIAQRPFDNEHQVPHCESEAFVWTVERADGTLDFHFAVENPQGISARAMAVILQETLSGQPLDQVAQVADDLPYEIFGRELSMGKTMGLNAMVAMVRLAARNRLRKTDTSA